jgi:hypothetical protein
LSREARRTSWPLIAWCLSVVLHRACAPLSSLPGIYVSPRIADRVRGERRLATPAEVPVCINRRSQKCDMHMYSKRWHQITKAIDKYTMTLM